MKLTRQDVIVLALWWGEGSKSRRDARWKNAVTYPVEITNTNPLIIKAFKELIERKFYEKSHKLKIQLQIHEGDNQEELEKFWSEYLGISANKFQRTIVRPVGRKVGKSNGTCKVRMVDKETYLSLESMLDKIKMSLV
ncbi:MAG: hypothetical protein AAB459_00020 [Patescibacteria group bacterium]